MSTRRLTDLLARGEYLLAYDEAVDLLATTADGDLEVEHLAVLALVRSGATDRALEQFAAFGLDRAADRGATGQLAEDIAALEARVAKQRALEASGHERAELAAVAAAGYEAVSSRRSGGPYTCINAATMWLVAGDPVRAAELARRTRAICAQQPQAAGVPESERYWRAATLAEAALLLGEITEADAALAEAAGLARGNLAARATTRRQLRMVASELGIDGPRLDLLANPAVVSYVGHRVSAAPGAAFPVSEVPRVEAAIEAILEELRIGSGHGSLASGADILFAEALLRRGAELHVVLPFALDQFLFASVVDAPGDWAARCQACLDAATTVTYSSDGDYLGDPEMFDFAARVAMGDALRRSEALDTEVVQVAVWDGAPAAHPAGTAVDIDTWAGTGRPTHVIPSRRDETSTPDDREAEDHQLRTTRALLFADIAGFSRLRDSQITRFMDSVMAELARCIDGSGDAVLLRRSWGDGIYVVFADTSSAAGCALAMQDSMRRLDLVALGLDAIRGLRIGAHVGPVFEGFDTVGQERNFFGADVTKAARIEPRTPEGEVFVTAPFAALVQLEGDRRWSCQYVGNVPTAKDYGVLPMYVLKPRT